MRQDKGYLVETIAEIKQMVLVLVTLNKRLKKRVSELELAKEEIEKEKTALEKQFKILQEDYDILKLTKAIQSDKEKEEAKLEISKLMREIDQCMLLIQTLQ